MKMTFIPACYVHNISIEHKQTRMPNIVQIVQPIGVMYIVG